MPKKGEASREAILRTSREIILEEGIEKLAHGAIAARLGLSKSAVLYHYSSKRALWEALIAQYVGHLAEEEALHEAPYIASGLSPEEAILPSQRGNSPDIQETHSDALLSCQPLICAVWIEISGCGVIGKCGRHV